MNERNRVGRPRISDPKKLTFSIKMNECERDRLVFIMERMNLSMSEAFRYCINRVYEDLYFEDFY